MAGKSKFDDRVWNEEIGPRYVNDRNVTGRRIADELGINYVTLTSQMGRRGFHRTKQAEAPPEDFKAAPKRPTHETEMGFRWSPDDPGRALDDLGRRGKRAAKTGKLPDFLLILRCRSAIRADAGWRRGPDGWNLEEAPDEEHDQDLTLRPAQTPPEGDWSTWLFLGGRGAGKTLAGASWLADAAERVGKGGRLALVGATLHDVREVMIGGPSGVMALPRWAGRKRPVYEPSRRRLRFPNGAEAWAFSAEDADSLRGPQFAGAWVDEFCAWSKPDEVLAMLRLGLRLGDDPRLVVTTTPRPIKALKTLKAGGRCVTTHAATRENAAHLAPGFVEQLVEIYGGTRREAQELDGLIVEMDGALFRAEDVARARAGRDERPARFDRVVVAVDPAATREGDACGIVAVGRAGDRAYVLADRSMRGLTPDGWARRVLATVDEVGAGAVVAEVNQGGDMVAHTLKTQRAAVTVRAVRATANKRRRAEPVAALYEQGRVTHLGDFRELEEELMALGGEGAGSLDRADALVWAVTDLMLTPRGEGPRISIA